MKDAIGSVTAITNMNGEIIDSNRFAPYGEALDPVGKNARLTNSPFGFTGETHDIEGGLVYLRARYYEPNTMRFLQQDTKLGDIKEPITRNLYAYAKDNPLKYTDPNGNFAFIPLLIKAGANGAADLMAQATMNYLFNPQTEGNVGKSFGAVNWWQVARSAAEGLIPWKIPGGRIGRAAATAVGDILVNALHYGKNYSGEQAIKDFAVGFIGDLAGGGLGVLISKYGAKAVAKGLKKIGFDANKIKKLTGIVLNGAADAILRVKALNIEKVTVLELKTAMDGYINETIDIFMSKFGTSYKSNPLRIAYEKEVNGLSSMVNTLRSQKKTSEQIARIVSQARRDLGVKYRDATPPTLRDYIYYVNISRYDGDPLGPTFNWLMRKYDGNFEKIIEAASRPNPNVDTLLGGFKTWLIGKLK